jgi:predicted ATPase/GAF domain-containing protein
MRLRGYSVGDPVWEESGFLVYGGTEAATGRAVLIRVPKVGSDHDARANRLRRDYEISASLPTDVVIRPLSLERQDNGEALVLEDDGMRPLQQVMALRRLELSEVVSVGVKLADLLGKLHARHIIHRNLNPHSVWYDQGTGEVRLADLGLAGRVAEEGYEIPLAGQIKGLLTHVAPEQTGRLVQVVDHRADHYSAGIILYQLLAGRLPFNFADPLQIVHAHLARLPEPPHRVDPRVPVPLSNITMKLLAKGPDERYQSARGLKADLSECLLQLQMSSAVEDFPLGRHDSSETFQLSQKLYGRDEPRARLADAFAQTREGLAQLVVVSGAPGTGKSVLVKELQSAVIEANGHFVSGKFDQFRHDAPYAGLVAALGELVGQILSRSDAELASWREKLLAALGSRGRVLIDVLPELELITGPCPPVPELPVEEDRNRFNYVFRDFARALADEAHPLVIFLDDLQWVDAASLGLLRALVTDISTGHLLVVGAYRESEVGLDHRLNVMLEDLNEEGRDVLRVELRPLAVEHVRDLVEDSLRCGPAAAGALAELVHRKTAGNPFFVSQFLQFLYAEGLLVFDRDGERWTWDLERIESEGITDDVVDLMTTRISRLSGEAQRTLRLAAFLGTAFTLRTIATVCERDPREVELALRSARRDGLLVGATDRARPIEGSEPPVERDAYRFLHDRVQQAAYALTPHADRARTHLDIGRRLRAATSLEELRQAPFEIVNNLNRGLELILDSEERRDLSELNLVAARKAQATAAYEAALECLAAGVSLLGTDAWENDYALAYELHLRRLQVHFVTGAFPDADADFAILDERVSDPVDRAYVSTQKMLIDTASDRSDAAIELGIRSLRELGVRIPSKTNALHVLLEIAKNRILVGRRRPTALVDLPEMMDPVRNAALQILKVISVPAYIRNPYLMALVSGRIANMSIRFGNGPASPQGYVLHGLVVGSLVGDHRAGQEFGQTAVTLSNRFDDIGVRCNALYVFAGFINHWTEPLSTSLALLREAHKLAVNAGHADYAVYAALSELFTHTYLGTPLSEMESVVDRYQDFVHSSNNDFSVLLDAIGHWIRILSGREEQGPATTAAFGGSSDAMEITGGDNVTRLVEFLIYKLQLAYHLGEFELAGATGAEADELVEHVVGQINVADHVFFYGLAAGAMARTSPSGSRRWVRVLRRSIRKFKKWAAACPDNFEGRLHLLEAELLGLKNPEASLAKYDAALEAGGSAGFVQTVGITNERAGRTCLAIGRQTVASVYLKAAAQAYNRWGAGQKVALLASEFPEMDLAPRSAHGERPVETPHLAQVRAEDAMDLASVLKTAQTISGETDLRRLLDRLLRLVLENAGAQRGCVLVSLDGNLLIEARGSVEDETIAVLTAEPANTSPDLCFPIVQYVARTRSDLVIPDARADARFLSDPYVVRTQPKSVLCSPVLKQGELIGVLYLENNLTVGAFTPQRLQVLQLIASEVSIAIENARLSETLAQSSQDLDAARSKLDLLEKAKLELAKFVPESVQRAIDENPDAPQLSKRLADVSVLFLDIAGYTRMCETLGTDRAHQAVQRYFSSYLGEVVANGGEIAETAGDGLMILFQDPDPAVNASNAAAAALAIRRKTLELNSNGPPEEAVVVNVGINSGPASLGASKFESAAGTRYTYTATGSTTNIAARVGASAVGGEILVTAETAERIQTEFALADRG